MYRIAFISSLSFAFAALCLGGAVYSAPHAALAGQLDASIKQATGNLLAELHDYGMHGLREGLSQRDASGPDTLGYALFDPSGRRIAGRMNTARATPGWHRIMFLDPKEGADPARALLTGLPPGYQLIVAADLEPLEEIDHTVLMMFGVACVALVGIGALGTLRWSRLPVQVCG
ncbi:hypothetical protein [Novosphingobium pentaromativorans]|uniref:hypothetical protein n=1 Tax=Novosphingobium pentaromativorans TaxID=205844 RepID=UPI000AD74D71|nr:hypothetical protein [Novosphingobium pentaromativorans]